MTMRLEHANLHVRDIDGMIAFLQTAFPDFRVRHDTGRDDPERWVHVGNDDTYLALSLARQENPQTREPYSDTAGFNHLGVEVSAVEELRMRLLAGGYRESTLFNSHPARRRVYFYDPDGNDWEFVEYFTDDRSRRNDYSA